MKLLIDECLSPDLAALAWDAGWHCAHVARIGLRSAQDWQLVQYAIDNDWVIVTNDSAHFKTLVGRTAMHPGIVCLNAAHGQMNMDVQKRLFQLVLTQLHERSPRSAFLRTLCSAPFWRSPQPVRTDQYMKRKKRSRPGNVSWSCPWTKRSAR